MEPGPPPYLGPLLPTHPKATVWACELRCTRRGGCALGQSPPALQTACAPCNFSLSVRVCDGFPSITAVRGLGGLGFVSLTSGDQAQSNWQHPCLLCSKLFPVATTTQKLAGLVGSAEGELRPVVSLQKPPGGSAESRISFILQSIFPRFCFLLFWFLDFWLFCFVLMSGGFSVMHVGI